VPAGWDRKQQQQQHWGRGQQQQQCGNGAASSTGGESPDEATVVWFSSTQCSGASFGQQELVDGVCTQRAEELGGGFTRVHCASETEPGSFTVYLDAACTEVYSTGGGAADACWTQTLSQPDEDPKAGSVRVTCRSALNSAAQRQPSWLALIVAMLGSIMAVGRAAHLV
jgi:hypothetical protein